MGSSLRKEMMKLIIIVTLLISMGCSAQDKNITPELILGIKNKDKNTMTYITGLGDGISWANGFSKKQQPVYCPPSHLAMNVENHAQIILREYDANSDAYQKIGGNSFNILGLILIRGLENTFPCK
jgi:hypothetical protein